jgi:hypothetical protein
MVALAAAAIGFAVAPGMAALRADDALQPDTATAVLDEQGPPPRGRGPEPGRGGDQGMNAEQTDKSARVLALGPTGLLELRNVAGDITVTAAPGKDARVDIVRRSRGRTEADAKLGLERTRVLVDHKGDRAIVAVEPGVDRRPPYFVRVTYTVSAPAGTRIVASSLFGNVTVTDIKGDVTTHVTRGDVEIRRASLVSSVRTIDGDVTLSDIEGDRGITIGALRGDVQLERIKTRRIEVDVTSGDVELRSVVTDTVDVRSLSGSLEYEGSLVPGGRYQFQTHSGSVRIVVTGPTGMELQATTFRGNLRLDPSLNLKTPQASRGSVRGTVGDGGAVVGATTFSGDVSVSRK